MSTARLVAVLVFDSESYLPYNKGQPGTDKQWGAPALVGLWEYTGETMAGTEFGLSWTDTPNDQDQLTIAQWWLQARFG